MTAGRKKNLWVVIKCFVFKDMQKQAPLNKSPIQGNVWDRKSKITLANLKMLGLLKEVTIMCQQNSADPFTSSLKKHYRLFPETCKA